MCLPYATQKSYLNYGNIPTIRNTYADRKATPIANYQNEKLRSTPDEMAKIQTRASVPLSEIYGVFVISMGRGVYEIKVLLD